MDEYRHATLVDLPPYADWCHGRWGEAKNDHLSEKVAMMKEHVAVRSRLGYLGESLAKSQIKEFEDLEMRDPEVIAIDELASRIGSLLNGNLASPDCAGWKSVAANISGRTNISLSAVVLDARAIVAATRGSGLIKGHELQDVKLWKSNEWCRLAIYLAMHHTNALKYKTVHDHENKYDLEREDLGRDPMKRYSQDMTIEEIMRVTAKGTSITEFGARPIACDIINKINAGSFYKKLTTDALKKSREQTVKHRKAAGLHPKHDDAEHLTNSLIFGRDPAGIRTLPLEMRETIHAGKIHSYISRIATAMAPNIANRI